ncbi:Guanine nucleotide exchange factor lte1 [Taxawa tesnikishii (nom. ined.)]|nr:Guanine nucleotide exchange factor lte1 [Dothideales sp. JES 119]
MTRRPTHGHKRSGSFSDALRDDRAPLPFSSKIDLTDLENLPPQNVTGGLIRGILVQPGSPYIVSYAPLSPPLRATMHYLRVGTGFLEPPSPNPSVAKTLMGNVRRALSTRHNASAPIGNAQGMKSSSGSRRHRRLARQNSNSADSDCGKRPQKMRSDFLAATVIRVYAQHAQRNTVGIHDSEADSPPTQEPQAEPNALGNKASAPSVRRLDSHVTTGSRSIVIIDDTGSSDARSHTGRGKTPNSTVQSGYFGRAHAGTPDMSWMLVESLDPPERQSSLASATILDFSKVSASVPDLATLAAAQRESSNAASPLEAPVRVDHRSAIARTFDSPGPSSPVDEVQQTPQEVVLSPRKSSLTNPAELDLTPVAPNRLRRRPGGNLRAVDNVHDLGLSHRRRSTGSTSSITYSTSTSVAYSRDVSYVQVAPRSSRSRQNSRDAQAQELQRKPSLRLLSTHSSQPNLRASFEAEVHRLASMPHDEEDGDIESTLLKLEGKFAKSSPHLLLPPTSPDEAEFSALTRQPAKNRVLVLGHPDHPQTSRLDLSDDGLASPMTNRQGASIYHLSQTSAGTYSDQPGQSLEETRLSGESVALLDNGLNDVVKRTRRSSMMIWPRGSTPPSASASKTGHSKSGSVATPTSAHSRKHFEHAKSPKQGSQRTITNRPATAQSSFLLDDHESLSGDEAALEADVKSQSRDDLSTRGVRSFFFDEDDDDDDDGVDEVEALPEPARSPLTPPSTAGIPTPNEGQVQDLTPGPAPPTHVEDGSSFPERLKPVIAAGPRIGTIKKIKTAPPITPPQTEHVPYILAYGSEDLARQFTIIEKDALEEVDWKELIDIKWKQSPPRAHNWADFVHMETASGIDIITARFNLVVKWVVSECLLTEDIDERAHCFVKFIHIAAHARRMRCRGYAFFGHGATNQDMGSRSHVRRETLRELETLVEPKRNFANLRTEMESTIIDHGCIPFIGVYTRDLLTNAQKPAFIDPVPPYTEPLINFERFQTAATIVKGMLRLLEASARYDLVPEPELLARCLWLAALDDAEITARSKALQQ